MTRTFALLVLALSALPARADETAVTISLPAEESPGCFADAMRFPRELVARLPARASITFTVEQTGAVRDVQVDGHASGALATQVRGGLSRCAWTPAADASGVPMTVAVRMPVRFETASGAQAIASARAVQDAPVALALR